MVGRKSGAAYDFYGFTMLRKYRRYVAVCNYCQKQMQNTAAARMQMHR